jgi:hypothetical protein
MPAQRKRAPKPMHPTKAPPSKLVSLCLDMEEVLNDAEDAARAINLIGHGLHDFVNENDARAITAAAWNACQKIEALRQVWGDLYKAAAGGQGGKINT